MMRREVAMVGCIVLVGCAHSDSAAPPDDEPVNGNPTVDAAAAVAVYVSSSLGTDGANGTITHPVHTLAAAIALAKAQNLPVHACAEGYTEAVTLADGVSMYGYLDCKHDWLQGTINATIAAPTSPAVIASSITLPTRFAGFDVRAPDFDASTSANAPASASIAVSVRDSTNLTFTSVLAHAGKGAQGADGTAALANTAAYGPGLPSFDQFDPCAGIPKPLFCTNSAFVPTASASAGGTVACTIGTGNPGGATGAPRIYRNGSVVTSIAKSIAGAPGAGPSAGAGGIVVSGAGRDGMPGGPGAAGIDGANGQWLLTAEGYAVGNGVAGTAGVAGSGGGGGAAADILFTATGVPDTVATAGYMETAIAASGGAGGCAGQAGTPGTGGGASIAALVVRSTVTFEQGRLESSAGGRAGRGALGSAGTGGEPAGAGFTRGAVLISGGGGKGGDGGRGGVSGHGAPGPSIALAYTGARPSLTQTNLAPGKAGEGQPALTGLAGTGSLPAATGVSEAEHQIP